MLAACLATALVLCLAPPSALAHELRPAYLELREEQPGVFDMLWKVPARGEMRLSLTPRFSGANEFAAPPVTRQTETAAVETCQLRADGSLRGQTIRIVGLEGTMTDVLVRVEFMDGSSWVHRLTPANPAATLPAQQGAWAVAGEYTRLGLEHILSGADHLLFVLALLLITLQQAPLPEGVGRAGSPAAKKALRRHALRQLAKSITAFTVAHSITLGLAALGVVSVPQQPVEAVIALSIVFVAVEILHARRGVRGITARAPWLVAFTFGLLHGFGFAGALTEVGLPALHIPAALFCFNVGVEVGQLLFIAGVFGIMGLVRKIRVPMPPWTALVPPYAIGSIAMFWVIQRCSSF